jgi:ornithine carbamoyltransferase
MSCKNFITLNEFTGPQLTSLIERTLDEKPAYRNHSGQAPLARRTLAMIFEKPSLRTRVSFEVAMTQLGGAAMYLDQASIGLGSREDVRDIARVLGRMADGVMARTFRHDLVADLAEHCSVPVVNGLTDFSHPCQAMADLVTVGEHFGKLSGKTLVFVGDGNNVARSLAVACAKLGMRFILSSPKGYELPETFFETLLAENPSADSAVIDAPGQAVREADVVYTDTWVSMGQEEEKAKREHIFKPYQLNDLLLSMAPAHAIVLHCLPAYRDNEITDAVFEAHAGTIFNQAENRLHFQRTLLKILLAEGGID